MKRMAISLAVGATLVLAAGAVAASGFTAAAKVQVRRTSLGGVLADGRGFTLYVFSRDARSRDRCVAINGCTDVWPVLRTSASPRTGAGIKRSLLGTIKLPSGGRQVTYAGHPLYTYVGDSGPGQTEYVGLSQSGGRWFAINANGRIVR
jgi:predicted lipoprotein with Yx(FWY)xxD motif